MLVARAGVRRARRRRRGRARDSSARCAPSPTRLGVVLPHERTHAGPKEGRLRLLRAAAGAGRADLPALRRAARAAGRGERARGGAGRRAQQALAPRGRSARRPRRRAAADRRRPPPLRDDPRVPRRGGHRGERVAAGGHRPHRAGGAHDLPDAPHRRATSSRATGEQPFDGGAAARPLCGGHLPRGRHDRRRPGSPASPTRRSSTGSGSRESRTRRREEEAKAAVDPEPPRRPSSCARRASSSSASSPSAARRCRRRARTSIPSSLAACSSIRCDGLARAVPCRAAPRSRPCSPSCRRATSASSSSAPERAATTRRPSTMPRSAPSSRCSTRSGVDFALVCEELGHRAARAEGAVTVVLDPIDGSINAKRGIPFFSLSLAVAEGPTMADVVFGFVHDFGSGEEWSAVRGEGAKLDGAPLDAPAAQGDDRAARRWRRRRPCSSRSTRRR